MQIGTKTLSTFQYFVFEYQVAFGDGDVMCMYLFFDEQYTPKIILGTLYI